MHLNSLLRVHDMACEQAHTYSNLASRPRLNLLSPFHRHRVKRVLAGDHGEVDPRSGRDDDFAGAVSVSFLTAA